MQTGKGLVYLQELANFWRAPVGARGANCEVGFCGRGQLARADGIRGNPPGLDDAPCGRGVFVCVNADTFSVPYPFG